MPSGAPHRAAAWFRDAGLRPAPHHEAEQRRPLILRSRAKRGVSKDEGTATGAKLSAAALYRLMAWLSPAYPVGAFSYSSGIEWAVEAGDIVDAATLQRWLAVMIGEGGGFCDAVFFVHAHRAAAAGDDDALRAVAELAAAFSFPRRSASGNDRAGPRLPRRHARGVAVRRARPVAGGVGRRHRLSGRGRRRLRPGTASPLAPALSAYLHAIAANLISAGVRLIPLGQTDGQRVLAALEPIVAATAARALADLARRSRQRDLSRRHRQHAARDAVHAVVPELSAMTSANGLNPTVPFASASAARSARARPR